MGFNHLTDLAFWCWVKLGSLKTWRSHVDWRRHFSPCVFFFIFCYSKWVKDSKWFKYTRTDWYLPVANMPASSRIREWDPNPVKGKTFQVSKFNFVFPCIYSENLWSLFIYVHVSHFGSGSGWWIVTYISPKTIYYHSPKTMVGRRFAVLLESHLFRLHSVETQSQLSSRVAGPCSTGRPSTARRSDDIARGRRAGWAMVFWRFFICAEKKHSQFPSNDIVGYLEYLGQHVIISTFATFVWTFS